MPTPTLSDLNEKERRALEMRYLGKTSKEIGQATGYNKIYVRNLFMRGGRLEQAYKDFAHNQQSRAQQSVDMALNRAMEEAVQAIERIIALSKDADNEAAIFKANEFLLNVAGIKGEATLKSFFQNKTYEQARTMVEGIFNEIYQKSFVQTLFTVVLPSECERCGKL